jgi:hypothetical protein
LTYPSCAQSAASKFLHRLLKPSQLAWRTYQLPLLDQSELSLVALLLGSALYQDLRRAGSGHALKRAIEKASPGTLQVIDSVVVEPRAGVVRVLLPTAEHLPGGFFDEGIHSLNLVVLDVQNWQLISKAQQVLEPSPLGPVPVPVPVEAHSSVDEQD